MAIWIQNNMFHDDKLRDYFVCTVLRLRISSSLTALKITKAEVQSADELKGQYPELKKFVASGQDDLTKIRFVVIMHNSQGDVKRVRCIQWNDRSFDKWRNMPKDTMNRLEQTWAETLMYAVQHMKPEEACTFRRNGARRR